MLQTVFAAARDRKRLQDIATVLVKSGLGDLSERLGLSALPGLSRLSGTSGTEAMALPERVRRALEELGPVFVKLGQILSTRADLLPPEWTEELERLHARVTPLPWEEIAAQIAEDLGAPPEDTFAEFDREPLAAASIAQVYRARLADGTAVAVKVRRPGLERIVEADLRILAQAARLAAEQWPELARFNPQEMVRHLSAAIREELDLSVEARNTEEVAASLAGDPNIVIPRIFAEYTGARLLVEEFVDGISPGRDGRIEAAGLDGRLLARRGAEAFLTMVLIDGVFHGDPHPGNLLALAGNRVGFIDFGMVGRIGAKRRLQLLAFLGAILRGEADMLAGVLMDWSTGGDPDPGRLEAGCDAFIARHGHGALDLGEAITGIMAIVRENGLTLPPDLAILFKALATADGVMKRLDPDFNAVEAARPLVMRAMRGRFSPEALFARAEGYATDFIGAAEGLPAILKLLLYRLRRGRIGADITLSGIDDIGEHIERAATKVAVSIVIAAFALGLAPGLMERGPEVYGVPVFAVTGILAIVAGVVWLLGLGFRRK